MRRCVGEGIRRCAWWWGWLAAALAAPPASLTEQDGGELRAGRRHGPRPGRQRCTRRRYAGTGRGPDPGEETYDDPRVASKRIAPQSDAPH